MKKDALWIADIVRGTLVGDDVFVTGPVQTDSRLCGPGSLYIARVGESSDGHDFLAAAAQAGAVCAIVERTQKIPITQIVVGDATLALGQIAQAHLDELRENQKITVIGITGSAGKTTTKDLLAQTLAAQGQTVSPQLSFNNEVGCPLTILEATESTRYLVLEMGSSGPGHLQYLTNLAPLDIAVELIVGAAHLGGFGSLDALSESKRELVEGLLPSGVAVLNYDDLEVRNMASWAPGPVYYFGVREKAPNFVWAENVIINEHGCPEFWLCDAENRFWTQLTLVGEHQVTNALAAAAVARVVGMPLGAIADLLGSAQRLAPHRMDVRPLANWRGTANLLLIDDSYNANPDSMEAGLRTARRLAGEGRLVAILGEMLELGEDSERLHLDVAKRVLAEKVDVLIGVGIGTIPLVNAVGTQCEAVHCADEASAWQLLPELTQPGDSFFLKGSLGSGVWKIADRLVEETTVESPGRIDTGVVQ